MAVLLFVLFWVLVAIGLVLMGIRSGNRGKPGGVNVARGGRAHWYIGFAIVALLFGAAVPIASSLGRNSDSRSDPSAGVRDLTEEQEEGRELFAQYCSQCHMLEAANAVAQVGPDLDVLRPTKGLVLDAIENGRARGNGAMARNLVVGEDAEHVADFVAVAVGQDEDAETPGEESPEGEDASGGEPAASEESAGDSAEDAQGGSGSSGSGTTNPETDGE